MEVISGWTHTAFAIDDVSRVGEARRFASRAVACWRWSDDDAGRLALIITELGTNLHRHARKGRLLIGARPDMEEVEVLSIDEGPGMPDLALSMQDGHSSGGTPGTGLGAVQRLSNDFDIHTAISQGTLCVARVRAGRNSARLEAAPEAMARAICLPAPGERECGDAWAAALDDERIAVMVADGLGHGPEAAKASAAAVGVFVASPFADLRDIVQRCHIGLQTTRGAAICAASLNMRDRTLTYAGAGNIMGRVFSGVFDKSIITQHGTAGAQIRKPEPASACLPDHALVIFHSDGIESRWKPEVVRPLLQHDASLIAAALLRDHSRHRDDATIVVIRLTQ